VYTSGSTTGYGGGDVAGYGYASTSEGSASGFPTYRAFSNPKLYLCSDETGGNSIACQIANLKTSNNKLDKVAAMGGVSRKFIIF